MIWKKAHIIPKNVLVRQTTEAEVIERNGQKIDVRAGNYIIKTEDGTLWQCAADAFAECYGEGWPLESFGGVPVVDVAEVEE